MVISMFIRVISVFFSLIFLSCFVRNPNQEDLKRVKDTFLQFRFNSFFAQKIEGKTDLELFYLSCHSQRVSCKSILQDLEKEDPIFYKKLVSSQN